MTRPSGASGGQSYGLSCSITDRPIVSGGRVCFPRELCGPSLRPPIYYGTLVPRATGSLNMRGILTAFMQEHSGKNQYILYGADEDMNVVQMLRPRDRITMLPDSGEVLRESTTGVEYVLSKPYFLDSSARVTY